MRLPDPLTEDTIIYKVQQRSAGKELESFID